MRKCGVSLPVEIYTVSTTIQVKRPRLRVLPVYWPCLCMKSWVTTLLDKFPHFVLGGFKLQEELQWRALFLWFWKVYKEFDADHPVYQHQEGELGDLSVAIPIATHGDEGRGARSSPFMVQSFQFVLSFKGPRTTNCSGYFGISSVQFRFPNSTSYMVEDWILRHSFCTRLLHSCISFCKLFNGEKTLRDASTMGQANARSVQLDGEVEVGCENWAVL